MTTSVMRPPKRCWRLSTTARSIARLDVNVTSTPALASRPAARRPTGPVPAVTTPRRPSPVPAVCSSLATAATAVVFDPFESSMTDTVNGPKNALRTALSSRSPAAMSVPPMKIAVCAEIFRTAREDGAVHQVAHGLRRHAAIAHDLVGTAVETDDAVEHAGMRRGVELDE